MPLEVLHNITPNSKIAIWHIKEKISYFSSKLALTTDEIITITQLIPKRQIERLVAKYLLSLLLADTHINIAKTPEGKPYIVNEDIEISISHSGVHLAVMIAETPCGVDIQYYTDKITAISRRFLRNEESEIIPMLSHKDLLHLIWSSKETAYKIYAKKQLDFLKDILISKSCTAPPDKITAEVTVNHQTFTYQLNYQYYQSYILVYGN